ncbi:hypothetical protein V9T40_010376 [Parthenolecanium corni]|uniref:Uncharacterized protein n=1 Tax=Parthenolecanium corni TaxID=536013 RepID=A0AAN9Y062_9HEMI
MKVGAFNFVDFVFVVCNYTLLPAISNKCSHKHSQPSPICITFHLANCKLRPNCGHYFSYFSVNQTLNPKFLFHRSFKPGTRVFSDETKMVIHHLQEALLDIIDLNLSQQELKDAVSDYLAELLEAGPAYIEAQKYSEKYKQHSNAGRTYNQVGSLLKQCPPQSMTKTRLNFPFTGQDPRASAIQEDVNIYESPSKLNLSITPPPVVSTPKPNFRHQSDPVTRVHQQPQADCRINAFSHGARLAHSEQTSNTSRRGENVRRNLFSAKQADYYLLKKKPNTVTFAKSESGDPTSKKGSHALSDYIEEFEKYLQHKYSSPECLRLEDKDNQQPSVHSPPSSGEDEEMLDNVLGGNNSADDLCGSDNSREDGITTSPPSRFEIFLRETSAGMETQTECPHQPVPPKETQPESSNGDQELRGCEEDDESVGLGEKLTENQRRMLQTRFEQFVRDYEGRQPDSDSAKSMTEEEFYEELLRIEPPKKPR